MNRHPAESLPKAQNQTQTTQYQQIMPTVRYDTVCNPSQPLPARLPNSLVLSAEIDKRRGKERTTSKNAQQHQNRHAFSTFLCFPVKIPSDPIEYC